MAEPNLLITLAPVAFVVVLGSLIIARAAMRSRQEMRSPGTWPCIYRELSRKQRASVRRALRDGQAVDDPRLAFAVVAAARSFRRHGSRPPQRLLHAVVGVTLLAVGALGGWRAVREPSNRIMLIIMAALLLLNGLLVIALVPVSVRQAKRVAAAEQANQALLDGS